MEQIITKLVQDYDQGKMTRRQLIANLTVAAAAAATSGTAFAQSSGYVAKAVAINHISYMVKDYKKTGQFYIDMFGMTPSEDNGSEMRLKFGDSGEISIGTGNRPGLVPPIVDHFGLTLANWDTDPTVKDKVLAEAKRRGLKTKNGGGSIHIYDPEGFDVQLGGKEQGRVSPASPQYGKSP